MPNDIAIKVENISKKYLIGENKSYPTLRDKLVELPNRIFKGPTKTKDFWALKDVSFEVKRGEVVGIIGRNGAGKSTLLKILARITEPTTGQITMHGRVASMLEVGTGFNPELTGRENIYLNGAIIGMKKSEIKAKFDDIVEFSGVGKFLDTPVKHYSSGMFMRLAFAVAAHLDSDIILIDEILAVGDVDFQKKSYSKIRKLSQNDHKTVVIVTHTLDVISTLCSKVLYLETGTVKKIGSAKSVVTSYIGEFYRGSINSKNIFKDRKNLYADKIYIKEFKINNSRGLEANNFMMGESIKIFITLESFYEIKNGLVGVIFKSSTGQVLTSINTGMLGMDSSNVKNYAILEIPRLPFNPGEYIIDLSISQATIARMDYIENAFLFSVTASDIYGTGYTLSQEYGFFYLNAKWVLK